MAYNCRSSWLKMCRNTKCERCSAQTKNGMRCKLKTCIRYPYCHIHARKELNLVVKKSNIANSGCGLFTTKELKPKTKIVEYFGETLTKNEYKKKYPNENAKYVFQKNQNLYVNSQCKRGLAAMSNSHKKSKCNARFSLSKDRSKIWIIVTKKIKENNEIYTYYGPDYKIS